MIAFLAICLVLALLVAVAAAVEKADHASKRMSPTSGVTDHQLLEEARVKVDARRLATAFAEHMKEIEEEIMRTASVSDAAGVVASWGALTPQEKEFVSDRVLLAVGLSHAARGETELALTALESILDSSYARREASQTRLRSALGLGFGWSETGVPVWYPHDRARFDEDVKIARAEVLLGMGRHSELEEELESLVNKSHANPRAYRFRYVRALSRLARGHHDQARHDLRVVARANPDHRDVQALLTGLDPSQQARRCEQEQARASAENENVRPPPPPPPREPSPWEVLGIEPGASPEDVRAAYKRRALEYHPDRVQHLGSRLRAVAEEEMRAINRAYESIMARWS